ncbi:hypothetical protein LY76DRAFT_383311 [Colletotrichum caudatum]|nr:hypothetical protein LY76DRAFT_383311 [Colletotrichum caudatum]
MTGRMTVGTPPSFSPYLIAVGVAMWGIYPLGRHVGYPKGLKACCCCCCCCSEPTAAAGRGDAMPPEDGPEICGFFPSEKERERERAWTCYFSPS